MTQHCHTFAASDTIGDIYDFMHTARKKHNNNVKFCEFLFGLNGLGDVVLNVLYRTGEGKDDD